MLAVIENAMPDIRLKICSIGIIDTEITVGCFYLRTEERQVLEIVLENGYRVLLMDVHGQSCCEHRHMDTDDDLSTLVGETLQRIWLGECTEEGDDYVTETAFLHIQTDRDSVTVKTYNEHNGYYGGLDPAVTIIDPQGEVVVNQKSFVG